jgi:hypothetical protein
MHADLEDGERAEYGRREHGDARREPPVHGERDANDAEHADGLEWMMRRRPPVAHRPIVVEQFSTAPRESPRCRVSRESPERIMAILGTLGYGAGRAAARRARALKTRPAVRSAAGSSLRVSRDVVHVAEHGQAPFDTKRVRT